MWVGHYMERGGKDLVQGTQLQALPLDLFGDDNC